MDDDLTRALEVHVAQMVRERRWPWMEPGHRSVGLDENNSDRRVRRDGEPAAGARAGARSRGLLLVTAEKAAVTPDVIARLRAKTIVKPVPARDEESRAAFLEQMRQLHGPEAIQDWLSRRSRRFGLRKIIRLGRQVRAESFERRRLRRP